MTRAPASPQKANQTASVRVADAGIEPRFDQRKQSLGRVRRGAPEPVLPDRPLDNCQMLQHRIEQPAPCCRNRNGKPDGGSGQFGDAGHRCARQAMFGDAIDRRLDQGLTPLGLGLRAAAKRGSVRAVSSLSFSVRSIRSGFSQGRGAYCVGPQVTNGPAFAARPGSSTPRWAAVATATGRRVPPPRHAASAARPGIAAPAPAPQPKAASGPVRRR